MLGARDREPLGEIDYRLVMTFAEALSEELARDPDRVLVREGARQLSVAACERITRRLAARLAAQVPEGELLAVAFSTGVDAALLLLAAHRVGIVVTFLDPAQPADQVATVLRSARPSLVVAREEDAAFASAVSAGICALDVLAPDDLVDAGPSTPEPPDLRPVQCPTGPGIVVFSSGSTGEPKGAVRGLDQMLVGGGNINLRNRYPAGSVFGELATFRFVTAPSTVYVALLGGSTVSYPVGDPYADLRGWILGDGVTVLRMQVSIARTIISMAPDLRDSRLASVSLAGEACFGRDLERLRAIAPPSLLIELVYGSSEAGALARLRIGPGDVLPDGPLRFARPDLVEVVDEAMQPLPDGAVGEVVRRNVERSRGYWRRPDLTDDRYLPRADGGLDHRTGDLGRFLPDGTFEVLGRLDSQVKVRGHNVEIAEVEAALLTHPEVQEGVVVDVPRPGGGTALYAYYVPVRGALPGAGALRRHLAVSLAPFKLPSRCIAVDRFPRVPGGKVDRRALRAATATSVEHDPVPPATATESVLCERLADLLAVPDLGVTDDFFEIGGDSLSAVEWAAWAADRFGVELHGRDVVACPTVRALSRRIDDELHSAATPGAAVAGRNQPAESSSRPGRTRAAAPGLLGRLATHGDRLVMVSVAGGGDSLLSQVPLARALTAPAVVYGAQGRGVTDGRAPFRSIDAFARVLCDELLELEPRGPYVLAGHSAGATVAHALGERLERHGAEVLLVASLDARGPRPRDSVDPARRLKRAFRARLDDRNSTEWPDLAPGSVALPAGVIRPGAPPAGADPSEIRDAERRRKGVVFDQHVRAMRLYLARPVDAPVLLVRARDGVGTESEMAASWAPLTRREVREVVVAGTHVSIKDQPFVQAVAAALDAAIAAAVTGPLTGALPGAVTEVARDRTGGAALTA